MSESKPGRRERYAALTRSAIVEAARMLFVERGFDDTSVDDIAEAAQVSKGAIYHHFKDKQEIFIDVYRDATKGVIENVVKVLIDVPAGSWNRIEAAASAVIKGYTDNREPRVLVRQVMGVLGAERTQALEGELAGSASHPDPAYRGRRERRIEGPVDRKGVPTDFPRAV